MQNVKSSKCINRLSKKILTKSKTRNTVAILAIILTSILFTSVFTIGMSVNKSFQEQNFRQVGSDFHGSFKDITKEQMEALKKDPLIKEAGERLILGMAQQAPFLKDQVEVSYVNDVYAKHSYIEPTKGKLPKEGTKEAAVDEKVLDLLGVKKEIGTTFELTYSMGVIGAGKKTDITETFVLSGWWAHDAVSQASHILVTESYVKEALKGYEKQGEADSTGTWSLSVILRGASNIETKLKQISKSHGYQSEDDREAAYVDIGVNWGYTGAQLSSKADIQTIIGIVAVFVLIICAGYLIIYNIFRISVVSDIRFYGLLKTVGMTGKQIRRVIRKQAIWLSFLGVPVGLLLGWVIGGQLTPIIIEELAYQNTSVSSHPLIFIGAAVFSVITVLISGSKPSRMAGKVSPVEAVRFTEAEHKKKGKSGEHGARIYRMALSNMGRSKSKTVLVILSLALAVVLLNVTYTFANGFDMDKYLSNRVCTDFLVGHADYFKSDFGRKEQGIGEETISKIEEHKGIENSGRIYGQISFIKQFVEADYIRNSKDYEASNETVMEDYIASLEKNEAGMVEAGVDLYGMEALPMSKLSVLEGDLSKAARDDQIVAVVLTDDYGKPKADSQHRKVGEEVELLYIDEYIMADMRTGEAATKSTPEEFINMKYTKTHRKTYTVCATVTMTPSMGYRFYGREQIILNAEEFKRETNTDTVMSYMADMKAEAENEMEAFLHEYTEQTEPTLAYESKQSYVKQFEGFQNMFLFMGGMLSLIIGLIGALNFVNSMITSVLSRRRETAVLQAVGMTRSQLKQLLIIEGCAYGMGAILVALIINMLCAPMMGNTLSTMFWFYTYRTTVVPILCMIPVFLLLGILIPLAANKAAQKQSLVDRIRNAE